MMHGETELYARAFIAHAVQQEEPEKSRLLGVFCDALHRYSEAVKKARETPHFVKK